MVRYPSPMLQPKGRGAEGRTDPMGAARFVVGGGFAGVHAVWAAGDTAAACDPFNSAGMDYPPTAEHAQRQGVVLAHNVAASLDCGRERRYRHRDLGLVADLGGREAVARPLGIPLTGVTAKVVTKLHHLNALPAAGNRLRVAADCVVNLTSQTVAAQLGAVPSVASEAALSTAGDRGA